MPLTILADFHITLFQCPKLSKYLVLAIHTRIYMYSFESFLSILAATEGMSLGALFNMRGFQTRPGTL